MLVLTANNFNTTHCTAKQRSKNGSLLITVGGLVHSGDIEEHNPKNCKLWLWLCDIYGFGT